MQLWFQRYLDKTTDMRADYTSNGNDIQEWLVVMKLDGDRNVQSRLRLKQEVVLEIARKWL